MLCGTVRKEEHSLWESPIQVSKTSNVYNIEYRIIIKILIIITLKCTFVLLITGSYTVELFDCFFSHLFFFSSTSLLILLRSVCCKRVAFVDGDNNVHLFWQIFCTPCLRDFHHAHVDNYCSNSNCVANIKKNRLLIF